ncbi:MAG: YidC/Oxa1 family membrane protein insertase [Clostridia bacterium]|nr:YidC/Oxa1 family membrane protein insertase [Clostridia bacterium]
MEILSLLASASQDIIQIGVEGIDSVSLNWIGNLIKWLFDAMGGIYGAVALGAICFTLILKTIVLPLDIYSRVKTKKQALIMEDMKPQMEKLKKQYANDEKMYSQKYQELQKANGYSPLAACLPTIVSLVIFMIVFAAFSTYSNYAVLDSYNELVKAYNSSVAIYMTADENDTDPQHFLLLVDGEIIDAENDEALLSGTRQYRIMYDQFQTYYATQDGHTGEDPFEGMTSEYDKNEVVVEFVQNNAQDAVVEKYSENTQSSKFLWIKNMWYPDSMLNYEVPNFTKFSSAITRASSAIPANYEESYNEVTAKLSDQKSNYNGYFVLIVLAIGIMFLQQFIMMRTQKTTSELSTVDDSGKRQNKWMMIIMPIIYAFFSFFYSAAFSLYMITNVTYSLISTLIINKVVAVRFAKRKDQILAKSRSKRSKKK